MAPPTTKNHFEPHLKKDQDKQEFQTENGGAKHRRDDEGGGGGDSNDDSNGGGDGVVGIVGGSPVESQATKIFC